MSENILDEKIRRIELFRDRFFLDQPSASYEKRENDLRKLIADFIDGLNEFPDLKKSDICFYSGRALNILSDYDSKCEEHLSRAVKLNPNSVESSNELGLCLWKKSDITAAKNCFESALEKQRNKVSLRSLSIIYRHENPEPSASKDCTKIRDLFEKCLKLAREAADLDPTDGYSWYLVGNGYLTAFFGFAQCKGNYIKSALESYEKALEDENQHFSAELYLNRGIALKYEEEYALALQCFDKACQLDPWFDSAKRDLQNFMAYLDRVHECVSKKGKIKTKRLQQMTSSICRQVDLGPYAGEQKMKTAGGGSVDLKYAFAKDLTPGRNEYTVLLLKVVGVVVNDDTIPYTFCGVDETGICVAVTVYNFSERFGVVIGNTVAILEPFVTVVNFEFRSKKYDFVSVRVPTPETLVVNRKKLGGENCALASVALSCE